MSKGNYVNVPKRELHLWPADPRFPIAKHIGWSRPGGYETDYHVPEPDNYSRAVMARHRVECKFIEDHVFYRDLERQAWWTVFYVPPSMNKEFDLWLDQQDYIIRWYQNKPAAQRQRKGFLYARLNSTEITDNERLYTMGYYNKFAEKHLKDDDSVLLDRLGQARKQLLDFKTFD